MLIRPYDERDEESVVQLWDRCGLIRPWNDPRKDIARKLRVQRELFLVGTVDSTVIASVMAGYDGHRGWMYYLAVDPEFRGHGIGRALLRHLEDLASERDCAYVQWAVLDWNEPAIKFYRRLGAFSLDEWTLYRLECNDGRALQ